MNELKAAGGSCSEHRWKETFEELLQAFLARPICWNKKKLRHGLVSPPKIYSLSHRMVDTCIEY